MTAKQLKYFGPKRKRTVKTRVVRIMAKRRYYKKSGSSRKGFGGGLGGIKSIAAPLVGGAADAFLNGRLPVQGIGAVVAGFVLGDRTTRQIGLYTVGHTGAQMFLGGGSVSRGGGL
jgi:hypothetical protein